MARVALVDGAVFEFDIHPGVHTHSGCQEGTKGEADEGPDERTDNQHDAADDAPLVHVVTVGTSTGPLNTTVSRHSI